MFGRAFLSGVEGWLYLGRIRASVAVIGIRCCVLVGRTPVPASIPDTALHYVRLSELGFWANQVYRSLHELFVIFFRVGGVDDSGNDSTRDSLILADESDLTHGVLAFIAHRL